MPIRGHYSSIWPLCSVLSQHMYPVVPSPVKIREKRVTASLILCQWRDIFMTYSAARGDIVSFPCQNTCHLLFGCLRSTVIIHPTIMVRRHIIVTWGCIQRERGVWDPTYVGANYNLTLSHSQLRSPAFQPNDNRKRENTRKEKRRGGGLTLFFRIGIEHGQPHAWVDLTPLYSWL